MAAYILISGLYFLCIAFFLLGGWKKHDNEIEEGLFIDRTHTDALKGIAAIGIVLSHISARMIGDTSGLMKLYMWAGTSLGGAGVDLFFFASGYGNFYSVKKLSGAKERILWLVKRVINIIIAYLVCYAISFLVLRILGYTETVRGTLNDLISLKMPLSLTWYLKIQLLLYVVLIISLFIKNNVLRSIIFVGLSLALTVACYRMGLNGQWWKSTMCFCIGFFTAEHKRSICQFLDKHKKWAWWISLICCIVLFVVVNPFDNFFIKVFGNAGLLISMMVLFELIGFDNAIAFCAWFLGERAMGSIGVILIVLLTAILSFAARIIDQKMAIR